MATETRLFVVASRDGSEEHLVRASRRLVAERFVTRQRYRGRVASQSDLERMLPAGVKIIDATQEDEAADDGESTAAAA